MPPKKRKLYLRFQKQGDFPHIPVGNINSYQQFTYDFFQKREYNRNWEKNMIFGW